MSSAAGRPRSSSTSERRRPCTGRATGTRATEAPAAEDGSMSDPAGSSGIPVVVGLPESLDRRMRLGPFPSARHALQVGAHAAVGGSVAAVLGFVWTVPFLGVGFLLSVYQNDGRALDE